MATQDLDITVTLTTTANVGGIFTLNNISKQTVQYDDTNVSSATTEISHSAMTQLVASSVTKVTYVYIKNLDATNFLVLKNDAAQVWGRVLPGESGVFPVAVSAGFEVQADTAPVDIEYALFRAP